MDMDIKKKPRQANNLLNYTVQTDGFDVAGLLKTETISRLSNKGTRLHQVTLYYTGEPGTVPNEIPTRIKIATYGKSILNDGWYLVKSRHEWTGTYADISLLQDVIKDKFPDQGEYQQLISAANVDSLADKVLAGELPVNSAEQILQSLIDSPNASDFYDQTNAASEFAEAVNSHKQIQAINNLDAVSKNPSCLVIDFENTLKGQNWIFGGRQLNELEKQVFTGLDQVNNSIIRNDGSLHIVELKQANIPNLIIEQHDQLIVGTEINQAVSQTMNYLIELDKQKLQTQTNLSTGVRPTSAIIVIGHTDFVDEFTAEEIYETLRTYNSYLTQIEVITYDQLIARAKQALDIN